MARGALYLRAQPCLPVTSTDACQLCSHQCPVLGSNPAPCKVEVKKTSINFHSTLQPFTTLCWRVPDQLQARLSLWTLRFHTPPAEQNCREELSQQAPLLPSFATFPPACDLVTSPLLSDFLAPLFTGLDPISGDSMQQSGVPAPCPAKSHYSPLQTHPQQKK